MQLFAKGMIRIKGKHRKEKSPKKFHKKNKKLTTKNKSKIWFKLLICIIVAFVIVMMGYLIVDKVKNNNKAEITEMEEYYKIESIGNIKFENVSIKVKDKMSYIDIDLINEETKNIPEQEIVVKVIKDSKIMALIGVNDIIRENAKQVIEKINEKNIETIMLTGDNKDTAEKIGKELGITKVIANVLPKEKAEMIKNLKLQNKNVMMCGDGINDSPALANANIGVSVKSGTDIAMDSSDVILTKNDLESILKLINISEKTIKNIKQNLFWAFFYNSLMIPIAIGILNPIGITINPMWASLSMVCSSLTVILNALRLKKYKV